MNKTIILRTPTIKQLALSYVLNLPTDETNPLELVIRPHKSKRHGEQNKLYWALLNEIAESTPWSAETLHEWFKRQYIGIEEYELPDGSMCVRGLSTTQLSVKEFAEYVRKVEYYAMQELGIRLSA